MTIKIELSSDIVSTDNFLHNRDQIKVTITQEIENVSVKVLQTRVQEKKDQIFISNIVKDKNFNCTFVFGSRGRA